MDPIRRKMMFAGIAAGAAALGGWFAWNRLTVGTVDDAAIELVYAQTLTSAEGQPFELASLRGRTVVLNFWATWCPPCIDEMPELATLHREIVDQNASVIGIGIDSPSNIREFALKHRLPYPLLIAGLSGSELSRRLGNQSGALPFTVVIDAKGRLIERKLGRIRLEDLRRRVRSALGSSKA